MYQISLIPFFANWNLFVVKTDVRHETLAWVVSHRYKKNVQLYNLYNKKRILMESETIYLSGCSYGF